MIDKAQEKILGLFNKQPRARFTPAEVQRRAGIERGDLQAIIDALRQLCRDGRLVRLKKNHYALPDRQNLLRGRVHAHPDGYGFLILDDKDAEDVYLNRREMRRVMHGDQVMVRIDRKQRGGSEAHIVQIIERGQKRLLGTYEEIDWSTFLGADGRAHRRHAAQKRRRETEPRQSHRRRDQPLRQRHVAARSHRSPSHGRPQRPRGAGAIDHFPLRPVAQLST